MIRMVFALMLALGGAGAATSLATTAAVAQQKDPAIEAVIADQIEAFRADDFARAFTYASPGIQGIFGSAERFGAMVRQGYPMVHRPAEVRFLDLRDVDGAPHQRVMLRDAGGAYHVLDYGMELGPDGDWLIDGVQLLQADQVGA